MRQYLTGFFVLLILSSCGSYEAADDGANVGDIWGLTSVTEDFSEAELEVISEFCSDLDIKETYFKNYIIPGSMELNYSLKKSDCSEESETTSESTSVSLDNSTLIFDDATTLYSENVFVSSSSDIKSFCDVATSDTTATLSKVATSGSIAFLYSVTKGNDCDGDNSICFNIVTGKSVDTNNYQTVTTLKYVVDSETNSSTQGFVKNLTYETSLKCTQDDETDETLVYAHEQKFKSISN